MVLGRAPFIGSTLRPSGMGGRRWRYGYGELAAWLGMAIDGRSPGGALVLQCVRRGGGMRSGRGGALRGRSGCVHGERWLWGFGRRTEVSGVFSRSRQSGGRGLVPRGGRCERGQCALCGRRRHGSVALGAGSSLWSMAALGSGKGQRGAVRRWLPPRHGEGRGSGLLRWLQGWPARVVLGMAVQCG